MQPKLKNATFCNPSATRIKNRVIIQNRGYHERGVLYFYGGGVGILEKLSISYGAVDNVCFLIYDKRVFKATDLMEKGSCFFWKDIVLLNRLILIGPCCMNRTWEQTRFLETLYIKRRCSFNGKR